MLPCQVWRGAWDLHDAKKVCRMTKRELRKSFEARLGTCLPHSNIWADFDNVYREESIHHSQKGNKIFLEDLATKVVSQL